MVPTPEDWSVRWHVAAKFALPVSGLVQDAHGVTHEIIGDFTACDARWCRQWWRDDDISPILEGWRIRSNGYVSCLSCLQNPLHPF